MAILRGRAGLWVKLALLAALVGAGGLMLGGSSGHAGRLSVITNPIDFRAFYCGARVVAHGGNPYLIEPLRSCELGAMRSAGLLTIDGYVMPAPLPPYALLAFWPLQALPFMAASTLWLVLGLVATALACLALREITTLPLGAIALFVIPALAMTSIPGGQLVPLVFLALVGCGWALRRDQPRWAVACAVATMLVPHLGLPVCLALFVWDARTRGLLASCAIALAALCVAAGGPYTSLQYFTNVLPAHERAEIARFSIQYGLSSALYVAGVSSALALRLGELSYLAAVAFGVYVAGAAATRLREPALVAFVPAACAVIGGPFLHRHDLAVALPLGLVLLAALPERRTLLVAALAALAVSPEILDNSGLSFMLGGKIFGWIDAGPIFSRFTIPTQSAEVPWAAFVNALAAKEVPYIAKNAILRLPVWFALVAFAALAAQAAFQSRRARSLRRLVARA